MAITLAAGANNTSGTIGGLAVGGLPDGTVDTDMIANGTLTSAKFVDPLLQNNIVNIEHFIDSTAVSLSNSASGTIYSFTYDKQEADSRLILMAQVSGSGVTGNGVVTGSATATDASATGTTQTVFAYGTSYNSSNGLMMFNFYSVFDTVNLPTGNTTITIGWDAPSSTATPFYNYNPQNQPDSRTGTTQSVYIIIEYNP